MKKENPIRDQGMQYPQPPAPPPDAPAKHPVENEGLSSGQSSQQAAEKLQKVTEGPRRRAEKA